MADLEESLLRARLRQYAERTDLWRPLDIDDGRVEQMTDRLDLVRPVGESVAPTLAGWLLFSRNPSAQFPQARVEFEAVGPAHWLRGRFGDEAAWKEITAGWRTALWRAALWGWRWPLRSAGLGRDIGSERCERLSPLALHQ